MGSTRTVDIHLLELRYAHCRIMNHQALKQLRDSIETYGQIVPALVVTEKDKLILVDGYLRVRALRACGKDQICVHLSEENEQNAMFSLLAKPMNGNGKPLSSRFASDYIGGSGAAPP
ncbi:conserved hypothetical protein, partial [delta proteobacterium NaphS2]